MLTLFIIPTPNSKIKRLIESFKDIANGVIILKDHDYGFIPESVWKMFMYNDEYLAEDLAEALPEFLTKGRALYDYYSLYKKIEGRGRLRYTLSPRIFKSEVTIRTDAVYPENVEKLKGIEILNGFILG